MPPIKKSRLGENEQFLARVQPLPDELASGLMGRICRIHGVSPTSLEDSLVDTAPGHGSRRSAWVVGLAQAVEMDPGELLFQHTLIPFFGAFSIEVTRFRDSHWISSALVAKKYPKIKVARICDSCVKSDLQERGFSYWRRSHQISGIVLCPYHDEILQCVPDRGAFNRPAEEGLCQGKASFNSPDDAPKLEVVKRYCKLANALLHFEVPFSLVAIQNLVRTRLTELKIRLDKNGPGRSIVDVAKQNAPSDWLDRHFGIRNKRSMPSYGLAHVARSAGHPANSSVYVLALALLYDTSDAALAALHMVKSAGSAVFYRQAATLDYASDRVLDIFLRSGGGVGRTAKEIGVKKSTLQKGLGKVGIISLQPILGTPVEQALADFFDGASLQVACARHGLPEEQLEAILRRTSALFASVLSRSRSKRNHTIRTH